MYSHAYNQASDLNLFKWLTTCLQMLLLISNPFSQLHLSIVVLHLYCFHQQKFIWLYLVTGYLLLPVAVTCVAILDLAHLKNLSVDSLLRGAQMLLPAWPAKLHFLEVQDLHLKNINHNFVLSLSVPVTSQTRFLPYCN